MPPSISENHGIAILKDHDLNIFSIGISTGGVAEMRMAKLNSKRQIIATTIDSEGATFAQRHIDENGLSGQITVKIEDVSHPLPYKNGSFDFIYARLVLHYLIKTHLKMALGELHRILKKDGKFFVVVRSLQCYEAAAKTSVYDPTTGFTDYTTPAGISYKRYFHTEESIGEYVTSAGFSIDHIESYEEQLYSDFQRTQLASHVDSLIELVASK